LTGSATEPAAGSPSVRLRRKIALAVGPYAEACRALVEHPRVAELWPEYLVVQHQIIRATVPLTEVALERARTLPASDSVAALLAEYLEEHVDEERGHDDDLLEDLEALGVERAAVLARIPSPTVASLVGCQYYWILHHHPIAFLGYVALMEGYPPQPELIEMLVARTGHSRAGFRTFAEHGDLDPGHKDHLDETLDALPLTPEHEAIMGTSALATTALAARAVEEVARR
jgi:Iron-containing redox enzyme